MCSVIKFQEDFVKSSEPQTRLNEKWKWVFLNDGITLERKIKLN